MNKQVDSFRIDDVKRLKSSGNNIKDFYITYYTILRPFHLLPDACITFLAHVLEKRYSYIKNGDSEEIADMKTMSIDSRRTIRKELGITITHMLYLFGRIRKAKILIGNSFNLAMVPKILENSNGVYSICFVLNYPDGQQEEV